jgi:type II secretory pathway component PulF
MPTFAYKARSRGGERIEGTIAASDRRLALAEIESLGQIPISVAEQSAAAKGGKKRATFTWSQGAPRMGTREVLIFTTELSDLLSSGMTLANALNTLGKRESGRPGDHVISSLRDDVVQGTDLSDAMARHPKSFSDLYCSMIRAGEASGALPDVLARLVGHFQKIQDTKEKVVMALVYPLIVLFMGVLTMIFCMIYVVPKFKIVFEAMGEALPLPTQMLINSSSWLVKYGWASLIVIGIAIVMINRYIQTKPGRRMLDGLKLRTPLIKGVVASGIFANMARTLSTLMSNGVHVLQALSIVERTVGNVVIGEELRKARDRVTDGTTISGPLAASKVFPVILTDMLAIGEQTGDMPTALMHIARRYESELDRNIKIFTTALEPILIVVVAVLVGFVAISILMAVFSLTNGLDV